MKLAENQQKKLPNMKRKDLESTLLPKVIVIISTLHIFYSILTKQNNEKT